MARDVVCDLFVAVVVVCCVALFCVVGVEVFDVMFCLCMI